MIQTMRRILIFLAVSLATLSASSEEVTYKIVEYNSDSQRFVLAGNGVQPAGSVAEFESDYGATYGNRYNQIPRNRKAMLYLEGWEGCTIKRITFSMCSNNKSGTIGYTLEDGETVLAKKGAVEFASEEWFGQWVSKDLGVYVDISREFDLPALTTDLFTLTLAGGTSEGSVYINAFTIDYDLPEGGTTESPLGWSYEKLEKKSTLSEGDVVMLYRSGNAAADIDGMETSHYLDAVGVTSTAKLTEPEVERFTLAKDETGGYWTLTDQWDRVLGASGKQNLAWNEGNQKWSITLGYDGAEITSSNSNYGTIRFNAPAESYARFWNYTSTSLPLPYLYRRAHECTPVVSNGLTFAENSLVVDLSEGHIGLRPTIAPASATEWRLDWTSSRPDVATVANGFVTLLSPGTTEITATTRDSGISATLSLTVTESTGIRSVEGNTQKDGKYRSDDRLIIVKDGKKYTTSGLQL